MSPRSPHLIDIGHDRIGEAARMLRRAFADDPLMRYLLSERGQDYHACLEAVFAYQCALQLELHWPLIGLVPRTRIAGVVGLEAPEQATWPQSVERLQAALAERMGSQAVERLDRYAARSKGQFPDQPMFYVRMIGVRPESQGQGYARLLLEEAHRRSEAHPRSTGVALDTEKAANVELYTHLGYQVVGRKKMDTFTIWYMVRPNHVRTATT